MGHIEMVLWLDANINATTERRLRAIYPELNIFFELDSCILHIISITDKSDSVLLLVYGSFRRS